MKTNALWCALLISTAATGQTVYKCPDPSGTIRFQQTQCAPGTGEAVKVDAVKPNSDGVMRPGEIQMLESIHRDEQSRMEAQAVAARRHIEAMERRRAELIEEMKIDAQYETARAIRSLRY